MKCFRFVISLVFIGIIATLVTSLAVVERNTVNMCLLHDSCANQFLRWSEDLSVETSWLIYQERSPEAAIGILRRFLKSRPCHSVASLRLGEIYWNQGHDAEALEI